MIRFVTALRSEAEPLIDQWDLHLHSRTGAFPWFASSSNEAALVVSGVGKRASAAATAFLHAKTGEAAEAIWLNVGIAGHGARKPGNVLAAHTIVDAATRERWYPPQVALDHDAAPAIETAAVISVDAVETAFAADAAYDMEAAGFYPTALRFQTAELIQVVKVTSDSRTRSYRELTPANVTALVRGAIEPVARIVAALVHLRSALPTGDAVAEPELEAFAQAGRWSTSERRRLQRLLRRWRALAPDATRSPEAFVRARSSTDVLRELETHLSRLAREHPV